MITSHKYSSICNQIFSRKFFPRTVKQKRGDKMNLKKWPFNPLDGVGINGEENGAGPGTPK